MKGGRKRDRVFYDIVLKFHPLISAMIGVAVKQKKVKNANKEHGTLVLPQVRNLPSIEPYAAIGMWEFFHVWFKNILFTEKDWVQLKMRHYPLQKFVCVYLCYN